MDQTLIFTATAALFVVYCTVMCIYAWSMCSRVPAGQAGATSHEDRPAA